MKVEIKYDEFNNPIGYEMSGENQEEVLKLNTIRNMQFFGFGDTALVYNGRTHGSNDNSNAGTLHYIQKKHK